MQVLNGVGAECLDRGCYRPRRLGAPGCIQFSEESKGSSSCRPVVFFFREDDFFPAFQSDLVFFLLLFEIRAKKRLPPAPDVSSSDSELYHDSKPSKSSLKPEELDSESEELDSESEESESDSEVEADELESEDVSASGSGLALLSRRKEISLPSSTASVFPTR